jgi:hypothetical protein
LAPAASSGAEWFQRGRTAVRANAPGLNRTVSTVDMNAMTGLKKAAPFIAVAAASAFLASTASSMGDWDADAAPAVHALAAGEVGAYLNAEALMGPFATLVQAPFVALSNASGVTAYKWASFPCLLSVGLLGLYLAGIARRRGASRVTQALIALFCLLNPITFEALDLGHPEELLTAALAVAAIAAAAEKRFRTTALLLGLAIASKQWAVIGILPALLVLPTRRLRTGLLAVAVAAALFLPAIVASPSSFLGVQGEAAGTGRVVTPWSAWYPFSSSQTEVYAVGGERLVAHVENAPSLADPIAHPLIVLLALAVPLAIARRRRLPITIADGFALLALLALLRCALDPVDNLYYHAPLLLAFVGWDAFSAQGLPLRSLLATTVAWVFWHGWHHLSSPATFNLAYIGVALALGYLLLSSLLRDISGRSFQFRHFSRDVAQISGIK